MTGKALLLFLVLAHCMELSWLAAWMVALAVTLPPTPSPLVPAILVFTGAFALTRLTTGRGWRVLTIVTLHAAGLCWAAMTILHTVYAPGAPLARTAWLLELLSAERTTVEGLALGLNLVWAVIFWRGGAGLARRPINYGIVCNRYDRGIAAFGVLYLITWMVNSQGVTMDDPLSHRFLFPFMASSLVAIGLTRLRGNGERRYLPGFQSVGILATFASATLCSAAALVLFLLPVLTVAAQAGLVVLRWAGGITSPFLLWILRLLFAPQTLRANSSPPPGTSPGPEIPLVEPVSSWWMDAIARVLAWIMGSAIALAVAALLCVGVYFLVRFLLSPTASTAGRAGPVSPLRWLLAWMRDLALRLAALGRGRSAPCRAREFYAALLGWARRTGHPRSPSETPGEFSARMRRTFPTLAPEIAGIVEAFVQESYREVAVDQGRLGEVHAAWCRLRSPRHWPTRVRGWFRR